MQGIERSPQSKTGVGGSESSANVGQQCFMDILLNIHETLVGVPPSPGLAAPASSRTRLAAWLIAPVGRSFPHSCAGSSGADCAGQSGVGNAVFFIGYEPGGRV